MNADADRFRRMPSRAAKANLDSQQVELIGRSALEARLMQEGFEVARPNRDKGIDLIVFIDDVRRAFSATPIQMKASSGEGFGVYRKYENMPNLVHVYVWNATTTAPRFFIMEYAEAAKLVPDKTKFSWTNHGYWRWPTAPKALRIQLREYEDRWSWLRDRVHGSSAVS